MVQMKRASESLEASAAHSAWNSGDDGSVSGRYCVDSPPPATPVPESSEAGRRELRGHGHASEQCEATPSEKLAALAAHERLRRAKAGLDALTGRRRRTDESTRIDAVAELLMACSCAPPDAASADPTDACEELEIEQPESPGPPSARRVFTPSPPRRGGE